jgi:hypothetical protein
MELHTYASVVDDHYQRLADILLSADSNAAKVQCLLAVRFLPAPPSPAIAML